MRTKILSTIIALMFGVSAFASNGVYNNEFKDALNEQLTQGGGKYGADSMACLTNLSIYRI